MLEQRNCRSDRNHPLICNLLGIVAAMTLGFSLAGCAEFITHAYQKEVKDPSPEMLSAFHEADRCGEMFKGPGWYDVAMVRPVYLPESLFSRCDEDQVTTLISFILIDQQDKKVKKATIYNLENAVKPIMGFFKFKKDELLAVRTKRLKSPFHQPVQTQIDGRTYWVVHDRVVLLLTPEKEERLWLTLEIYDSKPTSTGPPLAVWSFIPAYQNQNEPHSFDGKFYIIPQIKFGKEDWKQGPLVSLTVAPYSPSMDDILKGSTSLQIFTFEFQNVARNLVAMETLLNDTLIEWKSKGLPEYLQKTSAAKLKDMAIQMEKAWTKLDFEAKCLKDAADEDARQVTPPGQAAPEKKAPAGATSIATLIEQRKTILTVILKAVKQTAAQRAMEG